MLAETLAADLACALDPVVLARRMGIDPDPWQRDMLRSAAHQVILNCSRQSGKSTVTACLAAHTALYEPGAPVLLLSPSLRQSSELFRKVKAGLRALGAAAVDLTTDNALSVEMASGSRIVSLPGKEAGIRGFSGVRLLIVDEAARVTDDLYYAIRPMLATSGGRIVLLSTPFGKRGFFHDEWEHGGPDWARFLVPAEECPRIPADWLAAERRRIPAWWFEQEYLCRFKDTADQVFAYEDVQAALADDLAPLFAGG